MSYSIDIDTGGTFTDAFISGNGHTEWVKADSTPHDSTIAFFNCITEAAKRFGFEDSKKLLKQTDVIRLSTTIGTNTLIQKTGPKLGLIVTRGFEKTVYYENDVQNPAVDNLVNRDMILGIKGQVDASGNIIEHLDEEEVITNVKELLVRGARVICVSLVNATINPYFENQVNEIISARYPSHYLGSVPVVISTEVSLTRNDAHRTNAALLDAYFRREMARFLFKADEELSNLGYLRPFLIVHNWGGTAKVAKTRALHTYASGPSAGLFGAAYISGLYGIRNMITLDVGGTSTDVGILVDGIPSIKLETEIEGIPVRLPIVEIKSIGAGGGTIAKVSDNQLKVGPESAGALPGPACYDLGGRQATATDASVVLGYIDPDYFLGGRRKLNSHKAYTAITDNIANPLKLTPEDASSMILKRQVELSSSILSQMVNALDLEMKDFTLLSFGGAGGLYCCEIARALGIHRVYVPPFASVFSAFSSSRMDICHEYESLMMVPLREDSGEYTSNFDVINQQVDHLKQKAIRDMRAEGFPAESILFNLEMELRSEYLGFSTWVKVPFIHPQSEGDMQTATEEFARAFQAIKPGAILPDGGIGIDAIKLRATYSMPHPELISYPLKSKDPAPALKGKREVFWDDRFVDTSIYEGKLLHSGNMIAGPAIVEWEATTILIPKGMQFTIDEHLFGLIEEI